jgi:aminoglycoside phosphotransferase (APT) family kinase protein
VTTPAGIDAARVGPWLTTHVGLVAPITYELIAGGHSNLTYRVTDADGRTVVLRRPPLGHVLATAHDMAREHRIISAVGPAGVPVADALALCSDVEVNGAPFYVMSFVDGTVYDNPAKADALTVEQRRTASFDLIDVLVGLHGLDIDAIGLGDLAKRTEYIERQLARWTKQWAASKTRELPAIDEVQAWLAAHVPPQQGVAVVHGDYRFGNCLVDDRARIAGVLDWELCTLGDPLADLGYLCVYWSDPGSGAGRHNDPTAAGGFATRAEIVERYASSSGRDVSAVDFYVAFSSWRLAVISEGVYARYLNGAMGDASGVDLAPFADGVVQLAESALKVARGV